MKSNLKVVQKMETPITNIAEINAKRAKTIMNTTSELCGKRIAVVPTDLLDVDYDYQRVITANVNIISKDWRNTLCDLLVVSYRENKFFIIDGQHRFYAAIANGIEDLPCIVHTGLTKEDEARLFVRLNTSRKTLKPIDTFRANIICGNEDIPDVKRDMIVKRVCDRYHIEITEDNRKAKGRRLRALTTVRSIVSSYGENGLNWVFDAIKESNWFDCAGAYTDAIMLALKTYYTDNLNDLDKAKQRLIKFMNKYSPNALMMHANKVYGDYGKQARVSMALRELA